MQDMRKGPDNSRADVARKMFETIVDEPPRGYQLDGGSVFGPDLDVSLRDEAPHLPAGGVRGGSKA